MATQKPNEIIMLKQTPISNNTNCAIQMQNLGQVIELAEYLFSSGLCPQTLKDSKQVAVCLMKAIEFGVNPITSMEWSVVIKGRHTYYGDLVIGMVQAHPTYGNMRTCFTGKPFDDDFTAHCFTTRIQDGKALPEKEFTFSVLDAKRAGLWSDKPKIMKRNYQTQQMYETENDSPWYRFPKDMLTWRVKIRACRTEWADVTKGIKFYEEERDLEHIKNIQQESVDEKSGTATEGVKDFFQNDLEQDAEIVPENGGGPGADAPIAQPTDPNSKPTESQPPSKTPAPPPPPAESPLEQPSLLEKIFMDIREIQLSKDWTDAKLNLMWKEFLVSQGIETKTHPKAKGGEVPIGLVAGYYDYIVSIKDKL